MTDEEFKLSGPSDELLRITGHGTPGPRYVTFHGEDYEPIVTVWCETGEVTLADGLSVSEASAFFWGQLQVDGQSFAKRIAKLEAALKAAEARLAEAERILCNVRDYYRVGPDRFRKYDGQYLPDVVAFLAGGEG